VLKRLTETKADEVILIDNSPRDPLNRRLRRIPNVRVLEPGKNIGAAAAWNMGFKESTGNIILFSADDILLHSQSVWKAVRMISNDVAFVYGDYGIVRYLNGSFELVGEHKARPLSEDLLEGIYSGFVFNYVDGASPMRRDVFPGFDVSIPRYIDWDMWARVVKAGHTGLYLPERLFDTIDHPERGMTRDSNSPLRALQKIQSKWNVRFVLSKRQRREIKLVRTILQLYYKRKDLQGMYPEAAVGSLQRLLQWGWNITRQPREQVSDLSYTQLKRYEDLLEHMSTSETLQGKQSVEARLNELEVERDRLKTSLSETLQGKQSVEARLNELEVERDRLKTSLSETLQGKVAVESSLNEILSSFGWRFILRYREVVDRLFPLETQRRRLFERFVVFVLRVFAR